MLDKAEERAQSVNDSKQNADSRNGGKINSAKQAIGHDGCNLADLIRADNRENSAERRQHERQNHDAEALYVLRSFKAPLRSVFSIGRILGLIWTRLLF